MNLLQKLPLRVPRSHLRRPTLPVLGRAFFDTYRFVQRLEGEGLPRDAAEAVMSSLGEVLGECLSSVEKASVSRADYENGTHIQRLEVQGLRSEMQLMEKNEVAMIKQEIGRLGRETDKLSLQMGEDLRRAQADVRLELSLEKGRLRDDQSGQELRIKEADSRIDTEVSVLKTQLETVQWDLFKTLFPLMSAAGALFFSYLRFVS